MLVLAILSSITISVYGAETTNWSDKAINNAVSNGLFNSATAKSLANEDLTRAEMAAIINRAFGSTTKASLDKFSDVPKEAWYYDDMAKAVNMEIFNGSNGKLSPKSKITREEAFAVLARAIKLTGTDLTVLGKFSDAADISSWAKPEIAAMVAAGYVKGSNLKLNPKGFITRAQFAQIMDNLIKGYIKAAGTYTSVPIGNILINTPNVNLKGVTVTGDLIIGDGVGNGEVTLDSVKVTGRTVIRGGGVNSIRIIGDSSMGIVIVTRVDGQVRVVVSGGASVQVIEIADGSDDVLVEGTVGSLEVKATGITVTANNANIGTVSIEAEGAKIAVGAGSTVDKIKLDAPNASADVAGTVKSIEATKAAGNAAITTASTAKIDSVKTEAAGTTVAGTGAVTKVEANANDVKVDTKNTSVTAGAGTTGVTAGGNAVGAGNTSTPPPAIIPATTGSSGGDGPSTVVVSAITVTGDAVVGATLTAAPTPGAATGTYQWTICDTVDGTYTNIAGATNATYILSGAATKFVKVTFTASGSYTGTQTSTATAAIGAAVVPTVQATTLAFTDTDTDTNQMGGTLTWTAPANVSNVTHYVVYASTNGITKGAQIGLDVAVGTNQLVIPSNTAYAAYIIVAAKNATGEALVANYASVAVTDNAPVVVAYNDLTANGASGTVDTTELTITFDKAVAGLTAADFTADHATIDALTGTGPVYTLAISSITVGNGGFVQVDVAKTGFVFSPPSSYTSVYKELIPSTIVFTSAGPIAKTVGDAAFTNTVTGGVGTGPITYLSGTPGTATVNATTGQVTIVAAGSTVITATKTSTVTHAATTNTYTVNVAATAVTAVPNGIATATGATTITLGQVITGLATGDIVVKKDGAALTDVTDYALTGLDGTSVVITFTAAAALNSTSEVTVEMTKTNYTINGGAAIAVTNN